MVRLLGCAVGNVHYRSGGEPTLLRVCFGKVKSDARFDQLITFTRFFGEALPIKYRNLPAAALNQTCAFQPTGSISDGRLASRTPGKSFDRQADCYRPYREMS